jgi:hypothetical protein
MTSIKSIKSILLENKENFKLLKGDMSLYYKHTVISERPIDNETISIVMTTSDRTKQLYFTLSTIKKSVNQNIHLVIVDDSENDPVNHSVLEKTGLHIDLIEINRSKKFWINPCVNYNIGFSFIKGNRTIIQNSEVCHVGDILSFVSEFHDERYYVFDVLSSKGFAQNDEIYLNSENLTFDELSRTFRQNPSDCRCNVLSPHLFELWYHHHLFNKRHYHFLTFTSKKVIETIGGFCSDYAFAVSYDDDDFVLRLEIANIQIVNIVSTNCKLLGIHLYHTVAHTTQKHLPTHDNKEMWLLKKEFYEKNHEYIEISKNLNMFEVLVNYLFKE